MAKNQVAHPRSDEVWMQLITKCRESGLTDSEWCLRNEISKNSFYEAVRRLRKKAYALPERNTHPFMDLTAATQDVVQIGILPDPPVEGAFELSVPAASNQPSMELVAHGIQVRIYNNIDPILLDRMIGSLRSSL